MGDLPNGKHQEIHDNIIYIRGSVENLEETLRDLTASIHKLANSYQTSAESTEQIVKYIMESNNRTVEHVKNSLPLRMVAFLCSIICIAFLGGGLLKEILDSNALLKLLGV